MPRYSVGVHTTATGNSRGGRPRSEQARQAVLHAVDDLLVDVGYAAMTMKGIAERAGVGRQTVYRWWTTKAEILLEASVADAREELAVVISGDARADLHSYVDALLTFLTRSHAGAAYRALLGEAQHDTIVARLVADNDVLLDTARTVLGSVSVRSRNRGEVPDTVAALLIGPVLFWIMAGHKPAQLPIEPVVDACLNALRAASGHGTAS